MCGNLPCDGKQHCAEVVIDVITNEHTSQVVEEDTAIHAHAARLEGKHTWKASTLSKNVLTHISFL